MQDGRKRVDGAVHEVLDVWR